MSGANRHRVRRAAVGVLLAVTVVAAGCTAGPQPFPTDPDAAPTDGVILVPHQGEVAADVGMVYDAFRPGERQPFRQVVLGGGAWSASVPPDERFDDVSFYNGGSDVDVPTQQAKLLYKTTKTPVPWADMVARQYAFWLWDASVGGYAGGPEPMSMLTDLGRWEAGPTSLNGRYATFVVWSPSSGFEDPSSINHIYVIDTSTSSIVHDLDAGELSEATAASELWGEQTPNHFAVSNDGTALYT